ncbi:MAG: bi-domain-containing oxidoreductase [Deltaproteobacteria bacterium]|nr:bi-domain-containing oxidoreductase [Deltaproteobacteria bacterium]
MKQVLQNMKSGELRVAEVAAPALRKGGVVVRTAASCISAGTERTIMEFARKSYLDKARARPDLVRQVVDKVRKEGVANTYRAVMSRLDVETALGYSCAGDVVEAGAESGLQPGDRVACAGMGFASHAEWNYVPKNLVVRIPDGVAYEDASYTTLGAIAMQGVRTLDITLGEHVVVIGLGLIGLLALQLVEAAGGQAIGVDLDPRKVEAARNLGYTRVIARGEDVETAVQGWTRGIGADAVLIAASAPSSDPLHLAISLSRKRARLAMVGNVPLEIPHKPFYEKELQLRMSTSYGPGRYDPTYELDGIDYPLPYVRWTEQRNMASFLDLLAAGKVRVAPLTTHRFALAQAAEAYALLEGKVPGDHALGVLFTMPAAEPTAPVPRRVELPAARSPRSGTVRVGLVGAGTFTRGVLLPALATVPGIAFQGVSTASGATGEKAGQTHGFRYATTDWHEILRDPDIDLVVIATQHRAHAAMVVAALQAGKHVFVEKPLCVNNAELAQIRQAHAAAKGLLHVGFNRRFAPLCVDAKAHFAGLGEPLTLLYRINAGYAPPGSTVHREGGRLIGEVCHFIDTFVYLTGRPVRRLTARCSGGHSAALVNEDTVSLVLEHEDGHLGTIVYAARGNPLVPKERIEIHGGLKSAVLDDFTALHLYDGSKKRTQRALMQNKGHRDQMAAFVQAVRKGGPAPIDFETLAHVTALTFDAAEQIGGAAPPDDVADDRET